MNQGPDEASILLLQLNGPFTSCRGTVDPRLDLGGPSSSSILTHFPSTRLILILLCDIAWLKEAKLDH